MSGTTSSFESSDFLSQALTLSQDLLADILFQISHIDSFEANKEFFWNRQLMELTTSISKFVELTTLLSKVIMNRKKVSIPEIKDSHVHLLFILKAMNQAQQKQDAIVLEELIKYELKDNLTQWKIDLIPQTKRLLNP